MTPERVVKLRQGYHLIRAAMSEAAKEEWAADEVEWFVTEMCNYVLEADTQRAATCEATFLRNKKEG